VIQGAGDESTRGGQIPLPGDQDVNDLAELVDRSVQIDPPTADLDLRFVDTPAIAWGVPAGPGRINQQWGEPAHPAINRDVVDLYSAFGQQLFKHRDTRVRNEGTSALRARSLPAGTGSQRTPISAGGPDEHGSCGACA
jgi:hypothetical protein